MPRFLIALQGNGFADNSVCLERRPGLNNTRGRTLGLHRFVPHGQAVETLETILIDFGPVNSRWVKGNMRIQKELTKKLFVLLRTDYERARHLSSFMRRSGRDDNVGDAKAIIPEPSLILAPQWSYPGAFQAASFTLARKR